MERSVASVTLKEALIPLTGSAAGDIDPLLNMVGEARVVFIGEATHGTHEFYRMRAEITKRLIVEKRFTVVGIEGDWPDAYRVNRYVQGANDDREAVESLAGFKRFPTWMWRNAEVLDFVSWLREYNDRVPKRHLKVGFYGLDLYSMYASIDAVLAYLDKVDPQAAATARRRYECLEPYEEHPEQYGLATRTGAPSCREDVLATLMDIQDQSARYARRDGVVAADECFYAEQNARIVANAEHYYRAMVDEVVSTWNLRDAHMIDTLYRLRDHLARHYGATPKVVVWAHNSHVGDARATSMSQRHETNIGAMARRIFVGDSVLVGFTTYTGTVTAASEWHEPEERKRVRPARADSYEGLFHRLGVPNFFLPLRDHRAGLSDLPKQARERAIGVIYKPETEIFSHYFVSDLLHQFDAVYHYDVTRAVEPLERTQRWVTGEPPETYPSAL